MSESVEPRRLLAPCVKGLLRFCNGIAMALPLLLAALPRLVGVAVFVLAVCLRCGHRQYFAS